MAGSNRAQPDTRDEFLELSRIRHVTGIFFAMTRHHGQKEALFSHARGRSYLNGIFALFFGPGFQRRSVCIFISRRSSAG